MALLIGGHIRSGTTLLCRLCNGHPDIKLTCQFNNFSALGKSYRAYASKILNKWWLKGILSNNLLSGIKSRELRKQITNTLRSHTFVIRYLYHILNISRHEKFITPKDIETTLHSIFNDVSIVGDKYPNYVFLLDELIKIKEFSYLIIFRDCRDVTSSTLHRVRTNWRNQNWIKHYESAEKVAIRWVKAIESMERHKNKIHTVRYEDLVNFPIKELDKIAKWLGVDSSGFSDRLISRIRNDRIGKYKTVLTKEELEKVMEIAGPTMARLGYI